MTKAPDAQEIAHQITAACSGRGSPADVRERERAAAWLLANAERTFPEVLARAGAAPADPALIDLLGRFRRAEATPVLRRAFAAGDPARRYAAAGLGRSPDPAAEQVLLAAVASGVADQVVAGLAGLEASGNARHAARALAFAHDPHGEIRWAAVHAAAALGALDKAALAELAADDPDPDVRSLAAELAKQ